MYGSWDMEGDGQRFWSFWTVFCPFTLLTTRIIKILKNEKNTSRHYHFTNVYRKWQSYDVWFLRYRARRTEYFVILDHFLLFYHLNNPKNQNFEKMRKTPGDIIILQRCTISDNHMMYVSRDMKRDRQNFLSFWTVFCLLIPPEQLGKSKLWKAEKSSWRYHHFTQMYQKSWVIPRKKWFPEKINFQFLNKVRV